MPETFTLFCFLLLKATHKPIKIGTPRGVVNLEVGQYISGRLELAAALKISERCVRTSLDRLVKMEILTVEPTSRFSIYTIVKYNEYQVSDKIPTSKTPADDQPPTNERPADDQQTTTKQEHKHINTKDKPYCASSNDDSTEIVNSTIYTKAFEMFWELYPVRKNKGDAAKAFSKIKSIEYPAIKSGLIAAKESSGWLKDNGQWIPYPATWLRARGWEDEHEAQHTGGSDSFLRKIGAIPL